jgi:MFS family permease
MARFVIEPPRIRAFCDDHDAASARQSGIGNCWSTQVSRFQIPSVMRNLELRRILVLAGLAGGAFGLTIPFLTLIARERGVSLEAIGIMASSYLIAQTIFQIPFGSLSDRIGRTTPIALGFLVEAIAAAGFVFAETAEVFIALRVIQGISLALIMPALRALIADVTPVNRRGEAFAWLFACFSGGMLLGPPVGGILAEPLGRSPLFIIASVLNVGIAAVALFWLSAIGKKRGEYHEEAKIPISALFTRALIGAFILGFGARILEGMFSGIWSIYMADLGASDLEIGMSFAMWSIAFMICTPFGGRFADRGFRWRKLLPGNIVMALLIISYGLVEWIPVILFIGLLEGAVSTITVPALDAYLASVADPRMQGRVQGTYATIGTAGAAASALAGTLLYETSHMLPFIVAGGALVVLTFAGIGLIRTAELERLATASPIFSDEPVAKPAR